MDTQRWLRLLLPLGIVACASTPGARPDENTAVGHEQQARQHEAEATAAADSCKTGFAPAGTVCWSSITSPSAETTQRADKHLKMAADHRAAAKALRDAEARACVGMSERDRAESPFAHREDIEGVEPLYTALGSKAGGSRAVGASVQFRALPGMTAEWLQRLVDCHLARSAAMGYAMEGMEYCPLMLKDVTATVTSTGRGFAVAIRSENIDSANEARRRAEALASHR